MKNHIIKMEGVVTFLQLDGQKPVFHQSFNIPQVIGVWSTGFKKCHNPNVHKYLFIIIIANISLFTLVRVKSDNFVLVFSVLMFTF